MAILIPSREIIEKQNQKPTPGELTILNFLEKNWTIPMKCITSPI